MKCVILSSPCEAYQYGNLIVHCEEKVKTALVSIGSRPDERSHADSLRPMFTDGTEC